MLLLAWKLIPYSYWITLLSLKLKKKTFQKQDSRYSDPRSLILLSLNSIEKWPKVFYVFKSKSSKNCQKWPSNRQKWKLKKNIFFFALSKPLWAHMPKMSFVGRMGCPVANTKIKKEKTKNSPKNANFQNCQNFFFHFFSCVTRTG